MLNIEMVECCKFGGWVLGLEVLGFRGLGLRVYWDLGFRV